MKSPFTRTAVLGLIASIGSLAVPSMAHADEGWKFLVTPYIWLPAVDTDLSIDDVPVDFGESSNASEVLKELDFAFMLMGEARKDKFGVVFDAQYLDVGLDGSLSIGEQREYETDVKLLIGTLGMEYRLIAQDNFVLDVLAGARVTNAEIGVDIEAGSLGSEINAEEDRTFVDPIVGGKFVWRFADSWLFQLYGDIGGFGVSSKLNYQAFGTIGYKFNEMFGMHVGYRFFGMDFEDGDFNLDITTHGPIIGFSFAF